ncbi:MAG: hypothetical protein IPL08_01590 [Saprospiraceae bacterium]|nr:hypothetical protein [Saprospiraceae bacterium]
MDHQYVFDFEKHGVPKFAEKGNHKSNFNVIMQKSLWIASYIQVLWQKWSIYFEKLKVDSFFLVSSKPVTFESSNALLADIIASSSKRDLEFLFSVFL